MFCLRIQSINLILFIFTDSMREKVNIKQKKCNFKKYITNKAKQNENNQL